MQYQADRPRGGLHSATQYARSGDVNIAYQVAGEEGAGLDLVFVPGWISNVEFMWEDPGIAHYLSRLASFSRLIVFDKRGTGLSDRNVAVPSLEQRMDDVRAVMDAAEEFLTGVRHGPEPDRVLATVLFTDIVGSTKQAAALGDRRWRALLESYYALARRQLERFRGKEVDTTGDGFLATFDGPARAIRCACAISQEAAQLGVQIRAGLHTGECEILGDKVSGIAVHIAARVVGEAGANEVLVSSTVKDLVAGSGIQFEDRGMHSLKGVPDAWHLFAVVS